jgi:hypothetical protein
MPMSCKIVSPRLDIVDKMYFYLENGYGVDMFKVQIKNQNSHLVVVVFVDRRVMLLFNVLLLRKMYGMPWSVISKPKYKLSWIWKKNKI